VNSFWHGFLLSLSLCLDLGIVNVAVLRTSLQRGALAGFLVGLGSCIGDIAYFLLAVLGATALMEWAAVRWFLWIFGTALLLLLAFRMAREAIRPRDLDLAKAPVTARGVRLVAMGAALAMASPTAILWFAAVGGSVIASFGGGSLPAFALGFSAAGLAWAALFSVAAAALRAFGTRLVRAVSLVSALLFLYFAVRVFWNGWARLGNRV
jgi:L-lysine exporter family protein LysE/ArgO